MGKITSYVEMTAPAPTDLLVAVDDVGGTPTTKKLSISNLLGNIDTSQALGWSDAHLYRGGAGILEQRNGSNAQSYYLYNTYTDASNYERGGLVWASGFLLFDADAAGTGSQRNVALARGGVKYLETGSSQMLLTVPLLSSSTPQQIGNDSRPFKSVALKIDTEDAPFIDLQATADADATSAISTLTTSGATTHHIQIEINGSKAWIAASTNAPS